MMNNIQRAGAFVTVALLLAVVVLHGPWEGYTTARYSAGLFGFPASIDELPFLDWRSNAPVVFWFGSVIHVLVALFVVALLSAAWHYLFRGPAAMQSEQPSSNDLQEKP